MKKNLLSAIVILFALGTTVKAQLIWSDEFNGSISNNWNYVTGNLGVNNELEYYQQANATCQNNCLVITAKRQSVGGYQYTSARMSTKQSWTYGFFETKATLPMVQGMWPAFWMLGSDIGSVGWPACGELDILEQVNTGSDIHGTMHWAYNGSHTSYTGITYTNPGGSHYYQMNWNANAIKWYVDGVNYLTGNISNNINQTGCFHNPFFILVNLAVGGDWPGNNIGTLPASFWLDYVRVYQASSATKGAGGTEAEPTFNANGSFAKFVYKDAPVAENANTVVYPNPVNSGEDINITLENPEINAGVEVLLFDAAGKTVLNQVEKSNHFTIPTGSLEKGLYILKIKNGGTVVSKKLQVL